MRTIFKSAGLFLMTVFCVSILFGCHRKKYVLKDFLQESIISLGLENASEQGLKEWGVNWQETEENEEFSIGRMSEILAEISHSTADDSLTQAYQNNWLSRDYSSKDNASEKIAKEALKRVVHQMNTVDSSKIYFQNHEVFSEKVNKKGYIQKEGVIYHLDQEGKLMPVSENDVLKDLHFSSNELLDFKNAKIEFYGEKQETGYVNTRFHLLFNPLQKGVWNYKGYQLSYQIHPASFSVHVKKIKDTSSTFFEFHFSDWQPSFVWKSQDGKLEQVKLILDARFQEKIGVMPKREIAKKMVSKTWTKEDFLENLPTAGAHQIIDVLPIGNIEIPFSSFPFFRVRLELSLRFYADGKMEIAFWQHPHVGFEIYQGNLRFIQDTKQGITPLVKGSLRSDAVIDVSIHSLHQKLANIYLGTGLEATIKSQLFFQDGNNEIQKETTANYDLLENVFEGASNVTLCGELFLSGKVNAGINDDYTLLGKFGFQKTFPIYQENFVTKKFLQNGFLSDRCSFSSMIHQTKEKEMLVSEKILLERYSYYLKQGDFLEVKVKGLPANYQVEDLLIESEDFEIVKIKDNKIYPQNAGSTRVRLFTRDGKHEIYCHILVSDEK